MLHVAGELKLNPANMDEQLQEIVGEHMMAAAQVQEKVLDAQIDQMDELDEDDFERLREERKRRLIAAHRKKQEWRFLGHGEYQEVADQPEFFKVMNGKSKRVVCHFYTKTNKFCPIVDARLEQLAREHLETRFVKINAEKAPYLAEKLNIVVIPTILLALDGKVQHMIEGLTELGGQEFTPEYLAWVISTHKVCVFDGAKPEVDAEDGFTMKRHEKPAIREKQWAGDGSEFFDDS